MYPAPPTISTFIVFPLGFYGYDKEKFAVGQISQKSKL
jgi:hypothetical protein